MNRIIQYIKATRAEMNHVVWPTQAQTTIYTALVIAISVFVALFITFFDTIFAEVLKIIGIS